MATVVNLTLLVAVVSGPIGYLWTVRHCNLCASAKFSSASQVSALDADMQSILKAAAILRKSQVHVHCQPYPGKSRPSFKPHKRTASHQVEAAAGSAQPSLDEESLALSVHQVGTASSDSANTPLPQPSLTVRYQQMDQSLCTRIPAALAASIQVLANLTARMELLLHYQLGHISRAMQPAQRHWPCASLAIDPAIGFLLVIMSIMSGHVCCLLARLLPLSSLGPCLGQVHKREVELVAMSQHVSSCMNESIMQQACSQAFLVSCRPAEARPFNETAHVF